MHGDAGEGHAVIVRRREIKGQDVRHLLRGDHREVEGREAVRHPAQLQSHFLLGVH